MSPTKIEWTEETWNPVTGCTKISAGCQHCYAERMATRLQAIGQPKYANGFAVTCHEDLLGRPLQWQSPRSVFVNSMGDLFHADVPFEFIASVFNVMNRAQRHRFQVLTKRDVRLAELAPRLEWTDNIWMGVTVENREARRRIDALRTVPAAVRFLSVEPLLESLGPLDLSGIHWVIVGGESGPGARPMRAAWVQEVKRQCDAAGVAFFFKQWGGVNKKQAGRMLDGRTWEAVPRPVQRRLFA
jgi:protein gp37